MKRGAKRSIADYMKEAGLMDNVSSASDDFIADLKICSDEITSSFVAGSGKLNDLIIKKSVEKKWNPDQIKRVIEEVNNKVYLHYYGKNVASKKDNLEVKFDIAEPDVILSSVGDTSIKDKVASEEKVAFAGDLFRVTSSNANNFVFVTEKETQLEKIASVILDLGEKYASLLEATDKDFEDMILFMSKVAKDERNDIQGVYDYVCREANLEPSAKLAIKEGLNKYASISVNYTPSDDYLFKGLGEYSLNKKASDTPVITLPPETTRSPVVVKDLNALVETAIALGEKQKKLDILAEKARAQESIINNHIKA